MTMRRVVINMVPISTLAIFLLIANSILLKEDFQKGFLLLQAH